MKVMTMMIMKAVMMMIIIINCIVMGLEPFRYELRMNEKRDKDIIWGYLR